MGVGMILPTIDHVPELITNASSVFSTGAAATRSHDYYGQFMFWFSMGLSMHQAHHLHPGLAWIELKQFVRNNPKGGIQLIPRRHIEPQTSTNVPS